MRAAQAETWSRLRSVLCVLSTVAYSLNVAEAALRNRITDQRNRPTIIYQVLDTCVVSYFTYNDVIIVWCCDASAMVHRNEVNPSEIMSCYLCINASSLSTMPCLLLLFSGPYIPSRSGYHGCCACTGSVKFSTTGPSLRCLLVCYNIELCHCGCLLYLKSSPIVLIHIFMIAPPSFVIDECLL